MAPAHTSDVLILGAGAAGLAAARTLADHGLSVTVVEARDRTGGRIHTIHDPAFFGPVELGAEFVHGLPPATWSLLRAAHLPAYEIRDQHHTLRTGRLRPHPGFWDELEAVLSRMSRAKRNDLPFADFLAKQTDLPKPLRDLALMYIEGFDAADARKASTLALAAAEADSEKIQGDLLFRLPAGYARLLDFLTAGPGAGAGAGPQANAAPFQILLSSPVHLVRWRTDRVEVETRSPTHPLLRARRAIITLPVSILHLPPDHPHAVTFDPDVPHVLAAAQRIEMGPVVKVLLAFAEPFWESTPLPTAHAKPLRDLSFMHARGLPFPTWWTSLPMRQPTLTAWAGGPAAAELSVLSDDQILTRSLTTLSKLTGLSPRKLRSLLRSHHVANWQSDPLARGAYAYLPTGAANAPAAFAKPIDNTLFFAGEHTHAGLSGTVAGALESGTTAANKILRLRR